MIFWGKIMFCHKGPAIGSKWGFTKQWRKFFNFLHEVTRFVRLFWEKFCCEVIWSRNEPKMKFFKFYEKPVHLTFLFFSTKLQQHKGLKLTQWFLGEKFLFAVLVSRGTQNEVFQVLWWTEAQYSNFLHEVTTA